MRFPQIVNLSISSRSLFSVLGFDSLPSSTSLSCSSFSSSSFFFESEAACCSASAEGGEDVEWLSGGAAVAELISSGGNKSVLAVGCVVTEVGMELEDDGSLWDVDGMCSTDDIPVG